jgi:isopentenyl-diphosphate Delta-isomerase
MQTKNNITSEDPTAVTRKQDHITLAFQSQMGQASIDSRFYYEPLLAAHPNDKTLQPFEFLNKTFRVPFWVSSMTGGTQAAHTINHNLARAAGEYGFGMGLGSCRGLLYNNDYLADFAVRKVMGYDSPLFANLGIAQIEKLIADKQLAKLTELVEKLEADGLIVHINPMQEWLQPEGDKIQVNPIETICKLLELSNLPLIVKEVGQGMGKASLKSLLALPLLAVDFAAYGGTNFAQLELLRSKPQRQESYQNLANIGHTAAEMVDFVNEIKAENALIKTKQIIISGGVKDFLDGYYLMQKLQMPAVYGQASAFLRHAQNAYQDLQNYIETQKQGLAFAQCFLRVK